MNTFSLFHPTSTVFAILPTSFRWHGVARVPILFSAYCVITMLPRMSPLFRDEKTSIAYVRLALVSARARELDSNPFVDVDSPVFGPWLCLPNVWEH